MTPADDPFEPPSARPVWLTTLADLSLLLLGFFVLMQATDSATRKQLAAGLRAGFGADQARAAPRQSKAPMPMETARVGGFALNSAELPSDLVPLIGWAGAATHDPRVRITITGAAMAGERGATLLAYDRARAVAGRLVAAGAVPADRIELAAAQSGPATRAEVTLTLGFAGERQALAGVQP